MAQVLNATARTRPTLPRFAASLLVAGLTGLFTANDASAQHADFVLFGEPDPEAAAVPENQQFVHPITSPFFHENTFVTTDVRVWYLYHEFSNSTLGGNVQAAAVQLRLALTDTLQLVAYKDGYLWFDDSVVSDHGAADLAAGLKWNFYRDIENQLSLAAGVGYQLGIGNDEVLQDDDELRLWGSIDKGFDSFHVGATLNYFYPTGSEDVLGDSERISWHLHADYYVTDWFSPVVELNGYHTIDASSTTPLGFTGVDVANLGGGESQDVVTMGVGAEFRINPDLAIRAGYEFPLTDNNDLFGDRITVSLVWSF
ncbi:MAG: hypothetical protein AAGC44_12275 [Planctomycetota bacterium]